MISELFNMIKDLPGEISFFVEDGALKDKVIENYLQRADAHADILDFELDLSLRIKPPAGAAAPAISCRLEAGEFHCHISFSLDEFTLEERTELRQRLQAHSPRLRPQESGPNRKILRKKAGRGLLNSADAAMTLGLAPGTLKALIPCSDVRISQEGGEKTIEDYFWESELIERFVSIRAERDAGRRVSKEDVIAVAACCCDNDQSWAREVIAAFLQEVKTINPVASGAPSVPLIKSFRPKHPRRD